MDVAPQQSQSISDDQELSKVLAGISNQSDDKSQLGDLAASLDDNNDAKNAPSANPTSITPPPISPPVASPPSAPSTDLDSIKKDALSELRPLVDKLELSPEEMFDTYLL